MFIEQGNLFNSINFYLPPETPGMAGAVPFMPPYQDPNRENMTACLTQVATFLCPSDAPPLSIWPGGNNYLANQQTWACDLSERYPSTIAPAELPQGIFYYNSCVKLASVTDGLSNTAYFSEKIRGNGTPNPKTDMLVFVNQTSLNATYLACTQLNVLTAPPLTSRQGMSWIMGEMCCTMYNHVAPPNQTTCAGNPFPGNMANMAMQVPPSSNHPGGVNVLMGDASGRFIKSSIERADMAKPGYAQWWRGHLGRFILIEQGTGIMKYLKQYRRLRFIALLPLATLLVGCGDRALPRLYADHWTRPGLRWKRR